MGALLAVNRVAKRFGGLQALGGVSFEVAEGEMVGIIGPNGSGKTTLLRVLGGVHRPSSGRVLFAGRDITGWPAHRIVRLGIGFTHQIPRPFREMSVADNVRVGLAFGGGPRSETHLGDLLRLTGLESKAEDHAGTLTAGEQKRLGLAQALATGPRLILLDEIMAGLAPEEIDRAMAVLRRLPAQGVTLVLVEHVMQVILGLPDRVVVLDRGEKIAEGPPAAVVADPAVIEAYVGGSGAGR